MLSRLKNWFLKISNPSKLIIIAIIIGIGWFIFSKITKQAPPPQQLQTARAERGTLITSVTASGTITQGNSADITTQTTGIVKNVYVKDGDIISAGENIAEISLDINAQQKQAAAWATYLSAKNNLESAKAKINSLQSALFKANQAFIKDKGVTNPSDADKADPQYIIENAEWLQAEADYKNQQNIIEQAQAAVNSAWLSYTQLSSTITAPITGKISGLTLTSGLPITATTANTTNNGNNVNTNQSIGAIIAEGSSLQASVNLTEIDVIKVKPGQKVNLTLDALPNKTFTGKVTTINTNGSVSSGVTTYPASIMFDTSPENIYPNMAVNATIITNIKDNIILIPSSAIQTLNGQSTVQVIKNGKPTQVTIETGDANDTQTEITSGIKEGDTIITSNSPGNTAAQGQGAASPFGGGFGGGGRRGFGNPGGGGAFIRR